MPESFYVETACTGSTSSLTRGARFSLVPSPDASESPRASPRDLERRLPSSSTVKILYLLEDVARQSTKGRILRCSLADCSSPTVLLESADFRSTILLVTNDWLLFTAYEGGYGGIGYIGVLPK
ncbi:MAG: hypothetical protein QM784_37900 [Polyangiaceae bacterium]